MRGQWFPVTTYDGFVCCLDSQTSQGMRFPGRTSGTCRHGTTGGHLRSHEGAEAEDPRRRRIGAIWGTLAAATDQKASGMTIQRAVATTLGADFVSRWQVDMMAKPDGIRSARESGHSPPDME